MKFFKSLKARIAGLALALAFGGLVLAAPAAWVAYVGFNPSTNETGVPGSFVDLSSAVAPVVAMTGQTITAQKGGGNAGSFVATGTTTGASTYTFPVAAPTGRICLFHDLTTPADSVVESATSTYVVTATGTIVSGDTIQFICWEY